MAGDNGRQSDFFPAHFGGPADFPAMPHIGTLARLIIKYPACQLLGKRKPVTRSDADCGGTDFYDHLWMLVDVPQGWCGAPAEQAQTRKEFEGVSQNKRKSLTGIKNGRDTRTLLENRRKGLRGEIGTDGRGKSVPPAQPPTHPDSILTSKMN